MIEKSVEFYQKNWKNYEISNEIMGNATEFQCIS
jgi:hypothetical protein